ncbi:MAG TPA: carboxypeptidase-like regulatory domain-containing protein, partial [Thermoanaerobaculia bacterium]
ERTTPYARTNHVTRATFVLALFLTTTVQAAEICRFAAADAENPFRRWLNSQEVTCVAAGAPVSLPKGQWNVFVRTADAISPAPLLLEGEGVVNVDAPVAPAATLSVALGAEESGVVYAPRLGSAFPVDGARMLVPADQPLWLIVVGKRAPVAVIPVAPIPPGTTRSLDTRSGAPPAILGWLQVPEAEREAIPTATGLASPTVRAGSREADPLPKPALLHGAFYRLAGVEPGVAELQLGGRGWLPDRRAVKVQPQAAVSVAPAPLLLRAAGTLVVNWSSDQDLYELDQSIGACDDQEPARIMISIAKCTNVRGEDCTPVREEQVQDRDGSMGFDDVAPGVYRAEMRYGKLPPVTGMATVRPLGVSDLRMYASYFTVYGSVTRGGEPLHRDVVIEFTGGIGFASEEKDEYIAVFRPPPIGTEAQITVRPCDGTPKAVVLTDERMRPRARFDIDIPDNELTVQVVDTFTREALPGARVTLDAIAVLRPRVVYTIAGTTDAEGKIVWPGIPVRELRLTVTHAGYEKRPVPTFSLTKSETRSVEVQLVPLRGSRGRIVSALPFGRAAVAWYSPTGAETERAELAPDGTFVYSRMHGPEETMAVVSASHPLWVLRAPTIERRQTINLVFPNAPVAAFDIWLSAAVASNETRHTALVIGGLLVPQTLFNEHQTLRSAPRLLRGSGPQPIRDILATAPIDVILGPISEEVTTTRGIDLFARPELANAPRERVTGNAVVFEGER